MWRDLRYAIQGLLRTPAFTVAALTAIGLAVGANAAIFGLVDALWLRPPGVANPGQLVRVFGTTPTDASSTWSYPEYEELRDRSRSFAAVIARGRRGTILRNAAGAPELALVNVVSINFFSALGVRAIAGRVFAPGDEPNLLAQPGIVLGHTFWLTRFGGDPAIVGRTIHVGGGDRLGVTVLGVLPRTFRELDPSADRDLWFPPQTWERLNGLEEFDDRSARWFDVLGTRAPGVSVQAAHAEVHSIAAALARDHPGANAGRSARVVSDLDHRLGEGGMNAAALLGLVLLIVVITCVNVANLLLARAQGRTRELAVRVALGAGRWRLLRQLLVESLFLGAAGAAIGVMVAAWIIRALPAVMIPPPGFQSALRFEVDGRMLGFTLVVTALTTLLFGIVPSWMAARTDVGPLVKGATSVSGDRRSRTFLVTTQVAVSLVLLCAAAVLARSFGATRTADLGVTRASILTAWVTSGDAAPSVLRLGQDQLAALPGVERVAVAIRAPLSLSGGGRARPVFVPGFVRPAGSGLPDVKFNAVSANYFETIGTRLVAGRALQPADDLAGPPVVVVNEQFARQFLPNGALDQLIHIGGPDREPHRIVGIVQNAVINQIGEPAEPYFYLPFWRGTYGEITYLLRSDADAAGLASAVRRTLVSLDARLEPRRLITMQQYVAYSASTYRATAVLAVALGVLGLLLTAVGVYGVIAYQTGRRTREIGIRIALGAAHARVLALVLRDAARVTGFGLLIGVPVALVSTRLFASLLFGVNPWDPWAFATAALVLALTVASAAFIPAWRASRLAPSIALRDV
jgi:predicted permease